MRSMVKQWLFGCTLLLGGGAAHAALQVKHELGILTLPETPQRVVVLEYSFIDALAAVGVSPVGVADDLDEKRVIAQVRDQIEPWTSVGMRSQPSLEVIARLKPDLIIADLYRHKVSYEDLSKIAPTMLLKSRGETYQDALDSALLVGQVVGKEQMMRARLDTHKKLMEDYRDRFSNAGTIQFANVNDRGMWMHGPLSYTGSLLEYLGLQSAIPDVQDSHLMEVNLELLLRVNPDWLFYGQTKPTTVLDSWQDTPLFELLNIYKSKQVVRVAPELWSLNRGMLAAEGIAKELDSALNQPPKK